MSAKARSVHVVAAFTVLLSTFDVYAGEVENKALAEAMFDKGRELLKKGQYEEACKTLSASQRLDPAVGTLLNLADCYEKLGRHASAHAELVRARALASQRGDTKREAIARAAAERLEPTLAKLVVHVAPAQRVAGLEIDAGGNRVAPEAYDAAVAVDVGKVVVQARAPGYEPWSATVDASAGATVTVNLPPLERAREVAQPPASGPTSLAPEAPTTSGGSGNVQRAFAVVSGIIGVAGIGVGAFFGLRALSKSDEAAEKCPNGGCPNPDDVGLEADSNDAADVSTVAFVVGGVGLVGAVVLWATAPSSKKPPAPTARPSLSVSPVAGKGSIALGVVGRF